MNNRIKEAFGDVHAEESLKRGTLDAVRRLTHGYRHRVVTRRLAPALACLMIALGGMGGLYFTPTSVISIDVNPSLELSVNRFDRVVGVTSYNEDGRALVQELTLTHQNYAEAVEQVLDSPAVADCVSRGEEVTLTVVGENEGQSMRLLAGLEGCAAGRKNTFCCATQPEEVALAHEAGLSYGKYRAFLEAQALDPSLTPQEVQGMSMREIREMTEALAAGEEPAAQEDTQLGRHGGVGGNGKGNQGNDGGAGR